MAYLFMRGLIETRIDFAELLLVNDNYKDILLRHFQSQSLNCEESMKWGQPKYPDLYAKGPPHMRVFTVCTILDKKIFKSLSQECQNRIKESQKKYLKSVLEDGEEGEIGFKIIEQFKKENKVMIGMGTDKSKKYASQIASREALLNLGSNEVS